MGMQVTTRTEDGVPVLRLSGVTDEGLLIRLATGVAAVAADAGMVVVDIDHLIVSDTRAVGRFLAHLVDRSDDRRLAVACSRLTGRRLLRHCGTGGVLIFPTVREAVAGLLAVATAPRAATAG